MRINFANKNQNQNGLYWKWSLGHRAVHGNAFLERNLVLSVGNETHLHAKNRSTNRHIFSCWPQSLGLLKVYVAGSMCCDICQELLCSRQCTLNTRWLQLFSTSVLHKKMIRFCLAWDSSLECYLLFKHFPCWKFKKRKKIKTYILDISCTLYVLTIVNTISAFKMCYLSEVIKSNGPVPRIASRS